MDHLSIGSSLGVRAVLLPIKDGTKSPSVRSWQKLSYERTQEPPYQLKLGKAKAIGVLLGAASEGLCSIDFDEDEALELFLADNPKLSATLRTKGRRGANLWLILEGEIPKFRKLSKEGRPVGEWRSSGHTIIAGVHPNGSAYQRVIDAPPVRMSYEEINWASLGDASLPPPPSFNSSEYSESSGTSASLHSLHNIGKSLKAEEQAKLALKEQSSTEKLYRRWIENVFVPRQGRRNADLVAMSPFLFRAVGSEQFRRLTKAFYELNQSSFEDSLEQHLQESNALAANCRKSWLEELSPAELAFVEMLSQDHDEEALRICRDLSKQSVEKGKEGIFFLSHCDLADRLAIHPPAASRILVRLQHWKWLTMVELGTRRAKGVRGLATSWYWNLLD